MTGFRLVQNLHAYSGGTVRDSHPVPYSPAGRLPLPQALKRNIYLHGQYTRLLCESQSENTFIFERDGVGCLPAAIGFAVYNRICGYMDQGLVSY